MKKLLITLLVCCSLPLMAQYQYVEPHNLFDAYPRFNKSGHDMHQVDVDSDTGEFPRLMLALNQKSKVNVLMYESAPSVLQKVFDRDDVNIVSVTNQTFRASKHITLEGTKLHMVYKILNDLKRQSADNLDLYYCSNTVYIANTNNEVANTCEILR